MIIEENNSNKNIENVRNNTLNLFEKEQGKNTLSTKSFETENNKVREFYRERFFENKPEKTYIKKDSIKLYFFVTIIFLLGFLIGTIIFKNLLHDENIKQNVLSYDFFYEEGEVEREAVIVTKTYNKLLVLLALWIVGISVVGAPFLLFFCAYRGFALSVIICSVLLKYGMKNGYKLLLTNIFLPTFLTEIVIIFLTVSSLKVMFNILCERKQLKEEIIRHSFFSVIGAVTMFAGIAFEYLKILNNFT
ncbi:MAG: stage II sporulation protein M [Clostridia bacterium]|nr:stage II sporulation protein M [Clostridia bacterium]